MLADLLSHARSNTPYCTGQTLEPAESLFVPALAMVRTCVYVQNATRFRYCLRWKHLSTLEDWEGVVPAACEHYSDSDEVLIREYGAKKRDAAAAAASAK